MPFLNVFFELKYAHNRENRTPLLAYDLQINHIFMVADKAFNFRGIKWENIKVDLEKEQSFVYLPLKTYFELKFIHELLV